MKKDKNEKMKKIAVVTALLVAGVFAVTGICLSLKKEEPQYVAEQLAEPEMTAEPVKADISTDIPQPPVIPEIVISTETVQEPANDGPEQSIQSAPEKTEDLKPQEPPAEAEDTEKDVKENPPANTEIPAQPTPEPAVNPGNTPSESTGTPQNGAVTDGKIYIDGFGWINYNGGKSEVVQDGEIYENGNTIGIMD